MKLIQTQDAPQAVGPYSQAVLDERFVFVSGQLPIEPKRGEMLQGSMRELTAQVIDNLEAILKEAGSSLDNVVRVEVFLTDIEKDFSEMNEEYAKRFLTKPARQAVQVAALPKGSADLMRLLQIFDDFASKRQLEKVDILFRVGDLRELGFRGERA